MSQAASTATLARRSSRFVAWTRAWRAGLVPYDELPEEIALDEEHLVADAPGTWTDVPLRDALSVMARLHPDEIRLVLPAPGDPIGLPGPGEFTGAALLAGEGVVASRLGFVPEVREYTSGSGDTFATVVWRSYALPAAPPPPVGGGTGEAEADLNAAVLDAATALTRLDIAQWRPELAGAIAALRRPDGGSELPPGYDQRARRLFAKASAVDRMLTLADESAPGGAINSFEARARDEVLRPLARACRRALVAACNAPLI